MPIDIARKEILAWIAEGSPLCVNCTMATPGRLERGFAWIIGVGAPHVGLEDVALLESRGLIRPARLIRGGLVLYPGGMRRNYTLEYERSTPPTPPQ